MAKEVVMAAKPPSSAKPGVCLFAVFPLGRPMKRVSFDLLRVRVFACVAEYCQGVGLAAPPFPIPWLLDSCTWDRIF